MDPTRGRCECGGVQYSIDGPLRDVANCHCHRCRRFTGHHMAATSARVSDIRFDSDDTLQWYSPEPTVAYGFCRVCGSSLFWKTTARPESWSICAGALELPTGLQTTSAWWVSEHADYHQRDSVLTEYDYDG